jgi:hypothetical protein
MNTNRKRILQVIKSICTSVTGWIIITSVVLFVYTFITELLYGTNSCKLIILKLAYSLFMSGIYSISVIIIRLAIESIYEWFLDRWYDTK